MPHFVDEPVVSRRMVHNVILEYLGFVCLLIVLLKQVRELG